jgi:secreted protein with Ig-like and vWFA domain
LRVVILLTDGASNLDVNGNSGSNYCVGALYDTAVTARENNVTVYTIGFGYDVNDAELINIALQTGGQYYFAPDQATLEYIYRHIGQ